MTRPKTGACTEVTDRRRLRAPGRTGQGAFSTAYVVMPGCRRQAQGSRPATSEGLFAPGARVPPLRRALPLSQRPGLTVSGFINRRSRLRITAGYSCDKRSDYLLAVTAWRVDNYDSLLMHRVRIAASQVRPVLCERRGNTIPSISPLYAQARRCFTQVSHMVMHSQVFSAGLNRSHVA